MAKPVKCGECALCLRNRPLLNSHIISESFYKDLYENHKFSIVTADETTRDRYLQKGIRESLLCSECELFLGREYEDYGARQFRKVKARAIQEQSKFVFSGLSYGKFKLFQLTQLWRMSVSKHSFWSRVNLPDEIRESLRRMLLERDPGALDYLGVMMEVVIADDGMSFDAFATPRTILIGDREFILASFGGFSWYFSVEQSVTEERLFSYFVSSDGTLKLGFKKLREAWHLQEVADELESFGKL